jgi:hypothetical protein
MQLLHGLCCFDFISDIPLLQPPCPGSIFTKLNFGLSVSASWKKVIQNFSPQRKNSRNNPTQSPVMAGVHSNTTKLQTRRHSGRVFIPFFNRRITTLQAFIQWPQAPALLLCLQTSKCPTLLNQFCFRILFKYLNSYLNL